MTDNKPPRSFLVIAIAAVIWNTMGVFAFFTDTMMSEETMAALPQAQQDLYAAYPEWMKIFYALATIGGLLGSIGLLLKKSWSVQLFLLSLIAVAIQMGYSNLMTDAPQVLGMGPVIMSIVVIVLAALLLYYSRNCRERGWLM